MHRPPLEAWSLAALADLWGARRNHRRALVYRRLAVAVATKSPDQQSRAEAWQRLADQSHGAKRKAAAYREAAEAFRAAGNNTGEVSALQSYALQLPRLGEMLDAAAAARTAEAAGKGVGSFPIFPETAEQARAMGGRHGYEGYEYYCTDRARHPRSAQEFTWSSIDRIVTFDPFRFIHLIAPRPLLIILGTKAVTRHTGTEAFANAREPKYLRWIEGASHVDMYDKREYVDPAVVELAAFFEQELTPLDAPT